MVTSGKGEVKNFVQKSAPVSYGVAAPVKPCKKKRIRYVADPHIEPYKTGGRTYYRYRRGTAPPEHLGTADYIRQAVREKRARDLKEKARL